MTHSSRLKTLTAGLITAGLFALASVVLAAVGLHDALLRRSWHSLQRHPWWFHYPPGGPSIMVQSAHIVCLLFALCTAVYLIARLRRVFARTASAESFFFSFFLFSLSFEGIRLAVAFSIATEAALPAAALATRLVYAARLFGTLCLFAVSLYSLPVQYPKLGTILLTAVILSLTYAYSVPVDTSGRLSGFLYRLGDERGSAIIFYSLYLLTLLNPIVAATRERESGGLHLAVNLLLVLAGRESLFFTVGIPLATAGLAAFVVGSAGFTRRAYRLLYPF